MTGRMPSKSPEMSNLPKKRSPDWERLRSDFTEIHVNPMGRLGRCVLCDLAEWNNMVSGGKQVLLANHWKVPFYLGDVLSKDPIG